MNKFQRISRLFTLAILFLGGNSVVESKEPPWGPGKYSATKYLISNHEYFYGNCKIRISQVKSRNNVAKTDEIHMCRSWVEIIKSSAVTLSEYFPDIDGVGASYGVFIPSKQPAIQYFAFLKAGDYDGRLYLVDKDCNTKKLYGGAYFVTEDNKYLFSIYTSDVPGLSIVDLTTGVTVYEKKEIPEATEFYQWYTNGKDYFFTDGLLTGNNSGEKEDRSNIYIYNFLSNKLIKQKVTATTFENVNKVQYAFHPYSMKLPNCFVPNSEIHWPMENSR